MRRLALTISILAGAACSPGSGEYGSCKMTPDCQVKLFCHLPSDGGADGVCRYSCQVQQDCSTYSEVCGLTLGLCSSDGGY